MSVLGVIVFKNVYRIFTKMFYFIKHRMFFPLPTDVVPSKYT